MKTEEERETSRSASLKKETAGEADLDTETLYDALALCDVDVKTFHGTSLKKISAAESNLRCKNKESNWRV